MKRPNLLGAVVLVLILEAFAANARAACPVGDAERPADVVLVAIPAGRPGLAMTAADLARLLQAQLAQRRIVSSAASSSAEQSVVYGGVLLRDVLKSAGFENPNDR